jgi:hypothetical protein
MRYVSGLVICMVFVMLACVGVPGLVQGTAVATDSDGSGPRGSLELQTAGRGIVMEARGDVLGITSVLRIHAFDSYWFRLAVDSRLGSIMIGCVPGRGCFMLASFGAAAQG